MGSTLKEVPKTKTLMEKIKNDLGKRAALKASRTLLKQPRKLPDALVLAFTDVWC